jgi:hypothetical protein
MDMLGSDFARTFLTVKHSESAAFAVETVQFELLHHRAKF